MTSYAEAKSTKAELEAECAKRSSELKRFPKGPMGLTPDNCRNTITFQVAKGLYDVAFLRLQRFNARFVKEFAAEIAADRRAKFGA